MRVDKGGFMNREDLLLKIRAVELFQGLTEEELVRLATDAAIVNLPAGEALFTRGKPRRHLFVILAGNVELVQYTPGGHKQRLAWFGPGDFLGEGSILDETPHSTTALAAREVQAVRIPRESFLELAPLTAKVFSHIARVISRRMCLANRRSLHAAAQYESGRTRREHDLLGERDVPDEFFYGIQTLRALENFSISGVALGHFPDLVIALAMVKQAAARANTDAGLMEPGLSQAIQAACEDIIEGRLHNHFVVDMIQGGAGTSSHMNANEVIANRALEKMGHSRGNYEHCHPNNDVNRSQSTNDVFPTAVKVALLRFNQRLIRRLNSLVSACREKGVAFNEIVKTGRTQLQDAVPMTLGQTFQAWAVTLEEEIQRLTENVSLFLEVNLGATAIGTGLNAPEEYRRAVIPHLSKISGLPLVRARDLIEATQDTGSFVMYASALKRLAVKLSKISNDLRLLSSGPRAGLNEINLPPVQPGSTIMPGKVNPVIPEVVNQVAYKVIGNALTVTLAAEAGQLELNAMMPVIVQSLFESMEMLANAMETLTNKCITGITANAEHCRRLVESSIGLVTALVPELGYEICSRLAREALESGRNIPDLVLEQKLLSPKQLRELLSPTRMAGELNS